MFFKQEPTLFGSRKMWKKGLITEFYVYYKIIVARNGCLSTRHMLNWENKESINIGGTGMEAMNSFVTMDSFFSVYMVIFTVVRLVLGVTLAVLAIKCMLKYLNDGQKS